MVNGQYMLGQQSMGIQQVVGMVGQQVASLLQVVVTWSGFATTFDPGPINTKGLCGIQTRERRKREMTAER